LVLPLRSVRPSLEDMMTTAPVTACRGSLYTEPLIFPGPEVCANVPRLNVKVRIVIAANLLFIS